MDKTLKGENFPIYGINGANDIGKQVPQADKGKAVMARECEKNKFEVVVTRSSPKRSQL